MAKLVILFAELWRHRYHIIVPLLLVPLVALAWSMMNERAFHATTTLYLEKEHIRSPLLRNIGDPDNQQTLARFLKKDQVLRDTMEETGLLLEGTPTAAAHDAMAAFARQIDMQVLGENMIRITYTAPQAQDVDTILESLAWNFIHEILTPERFRNELFLSSLGEQVKYYADQEAQARQAVEKLRGMMAESPAEEQPLQRQKIIALEFDMQRAAAQRQLAQEEYDTVFGEAKVLLNSLNGRGPNAVVRFVEPPTAMQGVAQMEQHISYVVQGIILAILLSVFLIMMRHIGDNSFRHDEDVYDALGLKILGHLPNMGSVSTDKGRLTSTLTTQA